MNRKEEKEEREKLIDQVMDMVVTGYTYRSIAKQLGIGVRSVNSYVKSRTEEELTIMRTDAANQMAEMELARKKRSKRLWTMAIDPATKDKDKMKAMQLLQNEEMLKIKRQQLIGLIPAEAPLIAIQNNSTLEINTISDSIKRVHPELLEKFNKNKVELVNVKQEDT